MAYLASIVAKLRQRDVLFESHTHGGFKQSGTGKDMSQYSVDEYTIVKHVAIDNTGASSRPWHDIVWQRAKP